VSNYQAFVGNCPKFVCPTASPKKVLFWFSWAPWEKVGAPVSLWSCACVLSAYASIADACSPVGRRSAPPFLVLAPFCLRKTE
jgi:hypothetical protein